MGTVRFDPEIVNFEMLEVPLVSRMLDQPETFVWLVRALRLVT